MNGIKFFLSSICSMSFLSAMQSQKPVEVAYAKQPVYERLAMEDAQDRGARYKYPSAQIEETAKEYTSKYKDYENQLAKIDEWPLLSIWGGINYMMTLNEMKLEIKKRFETMKKNGLVISKDEFAKIQHKYFKDPRSKSGGTNALSYVWGNDYLRNQITQKGLNDFDVPKYVIVLDDPKHLKIGLRFAVPNEPIPVVNTLVNGTIHFEEVEGLPFADKVSFLEEKELRGLGFEDFSDRVNIIKGVVKDAQLSSKKLFIVDTEKKSFEFELPLDKQVLLYAQKRFLYLNQPESPDLSRKFRSILNDFVIDIDLS